MQNKNLIAIMIHDLSPWGHQGRAMLEIAWRLNKQFPLEIHSYTLVGDQNWPDMKHIPYSSAVGKPRLFKDLNYHFNSWKNLNDSSASWIQSTGTASMKSHVVQVPFIHHAWQKIAKTLPEDFRTADRNPLQAASQNLLDYYSLQMEKKIYTREKKYISPSHSVKKDLMQYFEIPPENIEIIYHGVNSDTFTPWTTTLESRKTREESRQELGFKDKDFVLLFIGSLQPKDGLLKSFKLLSFLKKQSFTNIKLLVVGTGDRKQIEELCVQHNIQDRVTIAPHRDDIRPYYWSSDCFFFPTHYETFGLAILEAMACGLPVVVSSLAGGSELIITGVNGVTINPHHYEKKLADMISQIYKKPEFQKKLGERARATALEHSWDKVGQQYCHFYQRIQENRF